MRLARILFKKCIRDFFRNIKQFISIIFIIALSTTLFVGLEANAEGIKQRVNSVFEEGNLSNLWVTITPDFSDYEMMDDDLDFIKNVSGNNAEVATRLYLPSEISGNTVTGLISESYPKTNTAISYTATNFSDSDFFFVDSTLVGKYERANDITFSLGDTMPLTIDTSSIKGNLEDIADNDESISLLKSLLLENLNLPDAFNDLLDKILTENKETIKTYIKKGLDSALSSNSITLDLKVNGIMSHPENIESGNFSTSNYLLSSRALMGGFIDNICESIKPEQLINSLNKLKEQYTSTIITGLIDQLIEYLSQDSVKSTIETAITLTGSDIKFSINHKSNAYIEQTLDHFYNQIVIEVGDDMTPTTVKNQISNYFKAKENNNLIVIMTRSTNVSIAGVSNDVSQAKQLTYVFPVIFIVVALLIVLTTIGQLVIRERTQIGTLKALGISNKKILFLYIGLMDFVGLIGAIIGCLIGPLIIPNILNIKYSILYSIPALTYVFPYKTCLAILAIVIVLISILTYLIIRQELHFSAAETMRGATPNLKLKPHKGKIKNTSLMMTFRNIRVHKAKSIMVIIGVLGCTSLLICGFGIDDTINYGKDTEIINYYSSDITINLNGGYSDGEAKAELEAIDGVKEVEEYTISLAQVNSNDASINSEIYFVSLRSKFFHYDDDFDEGHRDTEKCAITEQKAKKLNVKEGDTISFTLDGELLTLEIDKIFYAFSSNGVFLYKESNDLFKRSPTNAWLNVKDGYDVTEVKESILNCGCVFSAKTFDESMAIIDSYMSSIGQITLAVKVFAIMLDVIVLINLAILNFNERKREIATLRVLGFKRFEIGASLVYEVMILTTIGTLIGLLFGLPMEYMVLSINTVELVDWLYLVAPQTYLIAVVISLVTALVANILISTRIDKISMSESLKSVE